MNRFHVIFAACAMKLVTDLEIFRENSVQSYTSRNFLEDASWMAEVKMLISRNLL